MQAWLSPGIIRHDTNDDPPPRLPILEVIADPFDPATEPALKYPPTEVVNLIPGLFSRPHLHGILCAERMAKLEVARH